jgi:hypothetical protein
MIAEESGRALGGLNVGGGLLARRGACRSPAHLVDQRANWRLPICDGGVSET